MNVVQLICLILSSLLLIWSVASFVPWLIRTIKARKDKRLGDKPQKGEE